MNWAAVVADDTSVDGDVVRLTGVITQALDDLQVLMKNGPGGVEVPGAIDVYRIIVDPGLWLGLTISPSRAGFQRRIRVTIPKATQANLARPGRPNGYIRRGSAIPGAGARNQRISHAVGRHWA